MDYIDVPNNKFVDSVDDFVRGRLSEMAVNPEKFASTKEAFAKMVVLLVEFALIGIPPMDGESTSVSVFEEQVRSKWGDGGESPNIVWAQITTMSAFGYVVLKRTLNHERLHPANEGVPEPVDFEN